LGGQVVTIFQLYFFWAMTAGALTAVAATAAAPTPAFFRNSRLFIMILLVSMGEMSRRNPRERSSAAFTDQIQSECDTVQKIQA
jgi:hypothetical protein